MNIDYPDKRSRCLAKALSELDTSDLVLYAIAGWNPMTPLSFKSPKQIIYTGELCERIEKRTVQIEASEQ